MKEHIDDLCLAVLIAVCCLVQIDVSVFCMDIKSVLILVFVLIFLAVRLVTDRGFDGIQTAFPDILVYAAGALSLAGVMYKLATVPAEYGKYMSLLSLCILYFAVRNYFRDFSADLVFLTSISSAVICVLLLFHYTVDPGFTFPVSALLQDGTILSWLVLVIAVNVTGFCIYEDRGIWYGANAAVGFFLLFIQNNAIAAVITGLLFFLIAQKYRPRREMLRRVMQMFFAYAFLLCNMALVTGYTKILAADVVYDLELGVYLDLALALSGVWFFHVWDQNTGENDEGDKVLPQVRMLLKRMSVAAGMVLAVIMTAVVRGESDIFPDILGKVTALFRDGMGAQSGILETSAAQYKTAGVAVAGCFVYSIIAVLQKYQHLRASRHKKLFRIVSWMFVVQALFLTQSMASMPVYLIFIAVMLNEDSGAAGTTDKGKGDDANETDHPDSVLQRGGDTGNRAE